MKLMKGIYCYYLPIEQMMEEPESIQNATYSTDMHILKCLKLEDRSQGLESIAFSCFTLPVIKRPSTTTGTKELTERNLLVISTGTLDQDEIETTCAKSQLVKMGLTGLNVPDVAMVIWWLLLCILKHFLFNFLIYSVSHITLKLVKRFHVGQTYL